MKQVKAAFGMASIGLPIASGILFVILFVIFGLLSGGNDGFAGYFAKLYMAFVLVLLIGLVSAIIGLIRKETPSVFYIIGLLLNGVLLFNFLMIIVPWFIKW